MRKWTIIVAVLLAASLVIAAGTTRSVTYRTTKPTTGSPVTQYNWYLSDNSGTTWTLGASTADTVATLQLTLLKTYIVRVEGVDALNRHGPFSVNSDPFTPDDGAPGAPGKPSRVP